MALKAGGVRGSAAFCGVVRRHSSGGRVPPTASKAVMCTDSGDEGSLIFLLSRVAAAWRMFLNWEL
jgi:hypothetical protein